MALVKKDVSKGLGTKPPPPPPPRVSSLRSPGRECGENVPTAHQQDSSQKAQSEVTRDSSFVNHQQVSKVKSKSNDHDRRSERSKVKGKYGGSRAKEEEVRSLARNMAGSMETLIDNLHDVVGDIKQLVLQIDIVTDSLDRKHVRSSCSSTKSIQGSEDKYSLQSLQGSLDEREANDTALQESCVRTVVDQCSSFLDRYGNRIRVRDRSQRKNAAHRFSCPQFSRKDAAAGSEELERDFSSCRRPRPPAKPRDWRERALKHSEPFQGQEQNTNSLTKEDIKMVRANVQTKQEPCERYSKGQIPPNAEQTHSSKDRQFVEKDCQRKRVIECASARETNCPKLFQPSNTAKPETISKPYSLLSSVPNILVTSGGVTIDPSPESFSVSSSTLTPSGVDAERPGSGSEKRKDTDTLPGLKNWREKTELQRGSAESLTPQMDWSYLALSEEGPNIRLEGLKVPFTDHNFNTASPPMHTTKLCVPVKDLTDLNSNFTHVQAGGKNPPLEPSSQSPNRSNPNAKRDLSKLALTGLKIRHQMGSITERLETPDNRGLESDSNHPFSCDPNDRFEEIDLNFTQTPCNHQGSENIDDIFLCDEQHGHNSTLELSNASSAANHTGHSAFNTSDISDTDPFERTEARNSESKDDKHLSLKEVEGGTRAESVQRSLCKLSENCTGSGRNAEQARTCSVSRSEQCKGPGEPSKTSLNSGVVPMMAQGVGGAPLGWTSSSKALPDWPKSAGDLSSIGASDSEIDDLSSPFLPPHFHFPRRSSAKEASPSPDWKHGGHFYFPRKVSPTAADSSPGSEICAGNVNFPRNASAADSGIPGGTAGAGNIRPRKSDSTEGPYQQQNTTHFFQSRPMRHSFTEDSNSQLQIVQELRPGSGSSPEKGARQCLDSKRSSLNAVPLLLRGNCAGSEHENKNDSVFCSMTSESSSTSDTAGSGGFEVRTCMETSPESDVTESYTGHYENAMERKLERLGSEADHSDFSDADADVGSDVLEQSLTSMESSGPKYDRDVNTWKSYTMTHIDSDDVVSECASDILNENFIDRATTNPGFDDVNLNSYDEVNFPSIAY